MQVKNLPPETMVDITYPILVNIPSAAGSAQISLPAGILAREGHGNLHITSVRAHCPVSGDCGKELAKLMEVLP